MRDPERYLAQFFGLWDVLHRRHGWPERAAWWTETITDYERSGARQCVIRKPRRIGASTIVAPIRTVTEAYHGEHEIPPNDVGYFLFFSVKKDEAQKRLRGIATVLDALGKRYREVGDTIELADRPIAFKVQAASFRTAVGDTSIGIWCDEVSRWMDNDAGANPASEVIASVRPSIATMPNAKIWLVSSPLGSLDAHAAAFDQGDTAGQRVYWCRGTHLANPTITEADMVALEPDEKVRRREWYAEPAAQLSSAFDPDGVNRAFRPSPHGDSWPPVCIVDASSGRGDAFAWAICGYVNPAVEHLPRFKTTLVPRRAFVRVGGIDRLIETEEKLEAVARDAAGNEIENPEWIAAARSVLTFHHVDAVEGRFAGKVSGSQIVEGIAKDCRRRRVQTVIGDQREAFFLHSEFARHGLRFVSIDWTNANKIEAVTRAKRHFADGTLALPPTREKMKRELSNYAERITSSGAITYSGRGTGHDDEAALILTACMAELERLIPGSPLGANTKTISAGR